MNEKICEFCQAPYASKRSDSRTCSVACRKSLSRGIWHKTKKHIMRIENLWNDRKSVPQPHRVQVDGNYFIHGGWIGFTLPPGKSLLLGKLKDIPSAKDELTLYSNPYWIKRSMPDCTPMPGKPHLIDTGIGYGVVIDLCKPDESSNEIRAHWARAAYEAGIWRGGYLVMDSYGLQLSADALNGHYEVKAWKIDEAPDGNSRIWIGLQMTNFFNSAGKSIYWDEILPKAKSL